MTTFDTVRSHNTSVRDNPAYQAYLTLRVGFVVAPILFGLDKFTNLLTDWTAYLAPAVDRLIPGTATTAMVAVGVIEIVAGLVVAVRPKVGGDAAVRKPPAGASASRGVAGWSAPNGRRKCSTKCPACAAASVGLCMTSLNCARWASSDAAVRRKPPCSGSR